MYGWRGVSESAKSVVLVFWPFSTFPGIVPSRALPPSPPPWPTNARNRDLAQGLRQAPAPVPRKYGAIS